eukprot:5122125-Heterocapsa_arctica.AAC.1
MVTMIRHSNKRPLAKYASFTFPPIIAQFRSRLVQLAFGKFPSPPCKATPSHVTAIHSRDKKACH